MRALTLLPFMGTRFGPASAVLFGAGDFWRESPFRAVTIDY